MNTPATAAAAINLLVATGYDNDFNNFLNTKPEFVAQANKMFENKLLDFDESGIRVVPTPAFYSIYGEKKPKGVNYRVEAKSLAATMAMAEAVLESIAKHTAEDNPRKITIHKGAGLYKLLVRMKTEVSNLLANLDLVPQAVQPAF